MGSLLKSPSTHYLFSLRSLFAIIAAHVNITKDVTEWTAIFEGIVLVTDAQDDFRTQIGP